MDCKLKANFTLTLNYQIVQNEVVEPAYLVLPNSQRTSFLFFRSWIHRSQFLNHVTEVGSVELNVKSSI